MSTRQHNDMVTEIEALRQQIAEECDVLHRASLNAATLASFLLLDPRTSPLAHVMERLVALIGAEGARELLSETYLRTTQQDWTLLPMRLPAFRDGYEAGRRDTFSEGRLTDVELLDALKALAADGVFTGQEDLFHYHIGRLIGRLSGGVTSTATFRAALTTPRSPLADG